MIDAKQGASVIVHTGISSPFVGALFAAGPAAAQDAAPAAAGVIGQVFDTIQPVTEAGLHGFFQLLDNQPIAFILLSLALGTLIGKFSFKTISLGSTAGTLLVGVLLSMIAQAAYCFTYSIPGIMSSFMLESVACRPIRDSQVDGHVIH